MKTTMSVVPGFEEVSGVGDHAMIGTFGHAFYAVKGNTIIYLNTLYVPDASSRGAEIARRILSKILEKGEWLGTRGAAGTTRRQAERCGHSINDDLE